MFHRAHQFSFGKCCILAVVVTVFGLFQLGSHAWAQGQSKKKPSFMTAPIPTGSSAGTPTGAAVPLGLVPHVQQNVPQQRVGPNIQVNAPQQLFPNGLLGRSETSIATSPDGKQILVGFNDAQGFCGPLFGVPCTSENPSGLSGYGFSTDGGRTFTDGGAPPNFDNVFTRGDPWMDRGGFDNKTFYYSNLSVDATTGNPLGISVHRGHFGNGTFSFFDVHTMNAPNPGDAYDKDGFASAHDGSGAAYASVTNFIAECGQPAFGFGRPEVWRTHNGGNTWQGPVVVAPDITFIRDPNNPQCGLTGTVQQATMPAIGPEGEVYVAWEAGPTFNPGPSSKATIMVSASFDGGRTFGKAVAAARINSAFFNVPVGNNRSSLLDEPWIAVGAASDEGGGEQSENPSHKSRIYVTFSSATGPVTPPGPVTCPSSLPPPNTCVAQSLVPEQVYITFSDDHGATWSKPAPLAPAPRGNTKRWWPVVKTESGGNVDVIYLQSPESQSATDTCVMPLDSGAVRVGSAISLVDTYLVQSTDFGASFKAPTRVSSATSDWCTAASDIFPNFGDYISAFDTKDHSFAAWGDGRNGIPDTFEASTLDADESK
jgi:hypothetical protein